MTQASGDVQSKPLVIVGLVHFAAPSGVGPRLFRSDHGPLQAALPQGKADWAERLGRPCA